MESDRGLCLVLMPSDPYYADLWTHGVCVAFATPSLAARYRCVQAENVFMVAPYVEPLHQNLARAELVVADITARDPSVMYQLGYAQAAEKTVLVIAKEGTASPFNPERATLVTYPPEFDRRSLGEFGARLAAAVETLPSPVTGAEFTELKAELEHPEPARRQEAALTLGRRHGKGAIPALIRSLGDEDWNVRAAASWAIREIGDPHSTDLVVELMHDERPTVRRAAAWTLREIGGEAAVEALLGSFDDPSGEVREVVAWAFKELHDARAVPKLVDALVDEKPTVQRAAADALCEQNDPAALPALRRALGAADANVRTAAARAIGQMCDHDSVATLAQLLHDTEWVVRQAAARALGSIADPAAVPALKEGLQDAQEDVRWAVIDAVAHIDDPAARELVDAVAQDEQQLELIRSIAEAARAGRS